MRDVACDRDRCHEREAADLDQHGENRREAARGFRRIAAARGDGASLAALRRTKSGPLTVDRAVSLDALAAMNEVEREALLHPPDSLLADWPALSLDGDEAARFLTGLRRRVKVEDTENVRVYGNLGGPQPKAFLGSAHIKSGELIADRLLSPQEVESLLSAA